MSQNGYGDVDKNPPTLSERSSVWESLRKCLYVYLHVFYRKVILLRITDLYQIPPKPSPAEANPSPEHPGGTRVEPGWDPLGSVKTRGNQKNDHLATPAGRLKVLFTDNI